MRKLVGPLAVLASSLAFTAAVGFPAPASAHGYGGYGPPPRPIYAPPPPPAYYHYGPPRRHYRHPPHYAPYHPYGHPVPPRHWGY